MSSACTWHSAAAALVARRNVYLDPFKVLCCSMGARGGCFVAARLNHNRLRCEAAPDPTTLANMAYTGEHTSFGSSNLTIRSQCFSSSGHRLCCSPSTAQWAGKAIGGAAAAQEAWPTHVHGWHGATTL